MGVEVAVIDDAVDAVEFGDIFDGCLEGPSGAEGDVSDAAGGGLEQVAQGGVGVAVFHHEQGVAVTEPAVGQRRRFTVGGELFEGQPPGGEERTGDQRVEALFVAEDVVRALA